MLLNQAGGGAGSSRQVASKASLWLWGIVTWEMQEKKVDVLKW